MISTIHAESIDPFLSNGNVSGQFRTFIYDGQREKRLDRRSVTVGGILSYKTASYEGLSAGVSFFSSNGITSLTQMPESAQTQNLNLDGSSIQALGEAYVRYRYNDTIFTYGRQRLNFALANDYYNRMLPNSFEAASFESAPFDNLMLKGAYITRWKYKASDTFVSPTSFYGFERDVAILGGSYSTNKTIKLDLYDTLVPDVMHAPYVQLLDSDIYTFASGTVFSGAMQYLHEWSSGDERLGKIDTYLLGLRATLTDGPFSLSTLYTHIGHQTLLGTGGRYERMAWGGFLTYTDLQIDGESENAGSNAYGAVLTYRKNSAFEISAKYMHIDQSDSIQSSADSLTQSPRPDSDEYNIDTTYQFMKQFQVRTRLARIDYATKGIYRNNAFDENNIRIIADYSF